MLKDCSGCSSLELAKAVWDGLSIGFVFWMRPMAVERSPMMFPLAHVTPLLIPTYWAVFATGVVVGTLLGYRLALRKTKTAPIRKNS